MSIRAAIVCRRLSLAAIVCHWVAPSGILAQSPYYNTDALRPLRIEDAVPTATHEMDLVLPTARFEHLDVGASRWRFEPGVSYGILPQTDLSLRATFVYREATAQPRGGLSSLDFTIMHALNIETWHLPAIALAGEVFVPAGSARTGGVAYSIRTLVTRSGTVGRLHLNASYGSYNVGVVQPADICVYGPNFDIPCSSTGPIFPFIPDGPCLVGSPRSSAKMCNGSSTAGTISPGDTTPVRGTHWLAGLAFDHAFVLRSTLLMAELYAERYVGLYALTDWTAGIGMRRQLTPTIGFDAGVGRHFRGTSPSWIVTFGATYSAPPRWLGHGLL